jgi:hypothetical protein
MAGGQRLISWLHPCSTSNVALNTRTCAHGPLMAHPNWARCDSCAHPDQTYHTFRLIIKLITKHMANRSRLVQISCEKDDFFSKRAVKEEVLDVLISVTTDTFLTTLPIFPSQIVFG